MSCHGANVGMTSCVRTRCHASCFQASTLSSITQYINTTPRGALRPPTHSDSPIAPANLLASAYNAVVKQKIVGGAYPVCVCEYESSCFVMPRDVTSCHVFAQVPLLVFSRCGAPRSCVQPTSAIRASSCCGTHIVEHSMHEQVRTALCMC